MSIITDTMTITELSRLTNKSRPTIYKWLTLYDEGKTSELPRPVAELFDMIAGRKSKSNIYKYCESAFFNAPDNDELREIIELLKSNKDKLDLKKIKQLITEEINQ